MIERIRIDNFKCLVGFDWDLGPVNLLLGDESRDFKTEFIRSRRDERTIGGLEAVTWLHARRAEPELPSLAHGREELESRLAER